MNGNVLKYYYIKMNSAYLVKNHYMIIIVKDMLKKREEIKYEKYTICSI